MSALLLTALLEQRDDLRQFNELIASWPVQLAVLALYAALAVLVFTRVARDFEDGPARRYARAALVALGVFVLLEFVLGSTVLGVVIWPLWLRILELLWLAALCFYYLVRLLTRPRPAAGDEESRRRGEALEGAIEPMERELHGPGA